MDGFVPGDVGDERRWAHDLRHLLTLASLEFAALEPSRNAAQSGLARALERARALCDARLAGASSEPATCFDIAVLVREEGASALRIAPRRVDLTLDVEAQMLCTRRSSLARALRNLLINALQAARTHGTVSLTARATATGGCTIEIGDDGRGFRPEHIERYLRAQVSSQGNTGLGTLSIEDCANALLANLDLTTAPGLGSIFRLNIEPLGLEPRVLVLDRDRQRATELVGACERVGLRAQRASSLREALGFLPLSSLALVYLARGARVAEQALLERRAQALGLMWVETSAVLESTERCAQRIVESLASVGGPAVGHVAEGAWGRALTEEFE